MQTVAEQTVAERLSEVFGSISELEATYKIYARAKHYPNFTAVYIPINPYDKLHPGLDSSAALIRTKIGSTQHKELNLERSIRRTTSKIYDYVVCNEFDLFATFTFNSNRQDTERSRTKMANWLKNQQKRNGKFGYLIVPELHKDGALHFHGLLKGYPGHLHDSGKVNKRKQPIYNIKNYRSGFTTAIKIPPKDIERVGLYVRKYIIKDMPLFFGKNRYWVSSGLKLPIIEDNPPTWYLEEKITGSYINDFGIELRFPAGSRGG